MQPAYENIIQRFEKLNRYLDSISTENQSLKAENHKLKKENFNLKEQINNLRDEQGNFNNQEKIGKIASSFSSADEQEKERFKKYIDHYLKIIDQCLLYLENENQEPENG